MTETEPMKLDLAHLLFAVVAVTDPVERLRRLAVVDEGVTELAERIRRLKRATILELRRTTPLSWEAIGEILGVSGSRAEQLSKQPNP